MALNRIHAARNPQGLSLEEVKRAAPAAFADRASPKRSERYTFISTIDLLKPMLDTGWKITGAQQRATRLDGRDPRYTRHLLNLAPPDAETMLKAVGDVRPELTMINSHDGQAKFNLWAGLVRLACLNGLVVASDDFGSFAQRHIGDVGNVTDAAQAALEVTRQRAKLIKEMSKKTMDDKAARLFAAKAAKLAFDRTDFDPTVLLATRREADAAPTVWNVFNRVQENLIRGGVRVTHREGARKETVTRGITHVRRSVDLNIDLWNLAAAQIEKKAA